MFCVLVPHVSGSQRAHEVNRDLLQHACRCAGGGWRFRANRRSHLWAVADAAGRPATFVHRAGLFCQRRISTLAGTSHAWEVARMTSKDDELLKIYLLVAPFLVVGFGLVMYWFTGWLDRREQRRHPAE